MGVGRAAAAILKYQQQTPTRRNKHISVHCALCQALCLISMGVGRAAAIVPCVAVPNVMRSAGRRMGVAMQVKLDVIDCLRFHTD